MKMQRKSAEIEKQPRRPKAATAPMRCKLAGGQHIGDLGLLLRIAVKIVHLKVRRRAPSLATWRRALSTTLTTQCVAPSPTARCLAPSLT
eukprot:3231062-Pleurochrysis_carterae.AAC.1